MIDPTLGLSISVHSNPGVYALLLGSGVCTRFATKHDPRFEFARGDVRAALQSYEGYIGSLLNLMICGGYWSQPPYHDALLSQCFRRIANGENPQNGQLSFWNNLPFGSGSVSNLN